METPVTILYAEDDPVASAILRAELAAHRYDVLFAPDGATARRLYQTHRPDLLLLDLSMPKMDGLALTRFVREKDPHTHIIIYTTHTDPETEIALIDAGADEFFSKAKDPRTLLHHLDRRRQRLLGHTNLPHLFHLSPRTTFNHNTRTLAIGTATLRLRPTEARLLQLLCAKNNQPADRQYLLCGTWGNATFTKSRELKKYISLLRTHLAPDPSIQIECLPDGYLLTSPE